MDLLIALLLGVAAAAGAVLPPGMLNLSVTATSLRAGPRAGYWYVGGVVTVFLVQASVAIVGVNYLRSKPDIVELLSWWAVPVLIFLAVFFLIKYLRKRSEGQLDETAPGEEDIRHPYVQGLSVSLVNFLAIPYFFAIGSWLMIQGILSPAVVAKISFVAGAVAGAALILGAYARSAEWVDAHAHIITRHIHLVVAVVFGVLAGVQGWRVYGG
ncbi:hypothetical protein LEM8419_01810 [Neolewinella maritima]|uniref:Lysine transporter LysE n=1 Tax=Neolewinella maritima TaxID=1383882 RepID=A0ABN8F8Y5_9BACT|nr:LysE family transporter [Neolewinella maritima]CAH1000676.1 hypothetical protein LEM8419_01810 [Neolewinella maritima]